jgi:hypothetical protein
MAWLSYEQPVGENIKIVPAGKRGRRLIKGEIPAQLVGKGFNPETGRLANIKRKELAAERAMEGQRKSALKYYNKVRSGETPVVVSDLDAWELANEHLADLFYQATAAKSAGDVFSVMGRASGFIREKEDKVEAQQNDTIHDLEQAKVIYQIFVSLEKGEHPKLEDIVEGTIVDGTDTGTN